MVIEFVHDWRWFKAGKQYTFDRPVANVLIQRKLAIEPVQPAGGLSEAVPVSGPSNGTDNEGPSEASPKHRQRHKSRRRT